MRNLIFVLVAVLTTNLPAQENIEQYLITDSLEIESLIDGDILPDKAETGRPAVAVFTNFGLGGRQFNNLDDLNSSLLSAGYGAIPDASLGWVVGNRIDIGDHFSIGSSMLSNVLLNRVNEGLANSSRYTYYSFLLELGYRQGLGRIQLIPGLGLGFSQNILTLKPNGRDEMNWDELFINDDLMLAVRQIDFAISTDLSIATYLPKKNAGKHLLNLKAGLIFHPFSFGKPGVYTGESVVVKLNDTPSLNSTGLYFILTWG